MGSFRELYDLLDVHVQCGQWWPAQTRFEIVVGAVLTQNTNWGNVEKALENLETQGLLTPMGIISTSHHDLVQMIRPAGYFNAKAVYLQNVAKWFVAHDEAASAWQTPVLRESLLQVKGVGAETADDILLYVYDRPVFIYDLYARRLLGAAGFGTFATYRQAKTALDSQVEAEGFSTQELAHFHGLIVDAGKVARSLGGWDAAYEQLRLGSFGLSAAKHSTRL